jgi:4-aminobutyrate aminotransferase-like enzyme
MYDAENKKYLDLTAEMAVIALGHGNPDFSGLDLN